MKVRNTSRVFVVLLVILAMLLFWYWQSRPATEFGSAFISGNGRIEATEIAIASKIAGRVTDILVNEGDFVIKDQLLARMQIDGLTAQRDEALARVEQAQQSVDAAYAQVELKNSDLLAAQALVQQRESDLDAVERRWQRSETLARDGATSVQTLDDDRARVSSASAALAATKAQVAAAQSAVIAARAQLRSAESSVALSQASLARVEIELADSELRAPRDGRIQFRIAQPGEVVAAGGRILNLLDLTDVYMTFFLPETVAGRVALGTEVRILLDAAPQYVIPARVSFIASRAQFTPKTVETASERQKLMFRVRAQIPPELLRQHLEQVKTGLPGIAWIRLDEATPWPAALTMTSSD